MEACTIIVGRMKLCGVKSLKEDTKKSVTALLLALQKKQGHELPPAAEVAKLVDRVKEAFKASMKVPAVGGFCKYPMKLEELGNDFLKNVYDPNDPPADIPAEMSGLVVSVAATLKVRTRQKGQAEQSGLSAMQPALGGFMDMMKMMSNMVVKAKERMNVSFSSWLAKSMPLSLQAMKAWEWAVPTVPHPCLWQSKMMVGRNLLL